MGYAGRMAAHAQAIQTIAELEARLVTAPGHERVALLHALSQEYLYSDLDRALALAAEAHGLAQAQGDALGLAESIFAVGRAQLALANYQTALAYLETALSHFSALSDTSGEQRSLVRIADVYLDLGHCAEALEEDKLNWTSGPYLKRWEYRTTGSSPSCRMSGRSRGPRPL